MPRTLETGYDKFFEHTYDSERRENDFVAVPDSEIELTGGGRTRVHRRGQIVIRDAGPWTPAVHTLLRHLEQVGVDGAPRLVGSGLDSDGRETLTFIEGEFTQPGPWSLDGAAGVGRLLRDLHEATASYQPPPDAVWFGWHGRQLGGPARVIGHCDVAPWNIVARRRLAAAESTCIRECPHLTGTVQYDHDRLPAGVA
jgi:hypothetical protein